MKAEKTESKLVLVNYCRNCNKNLPVDAFFCNHCGAKKIENRITFRNLAEDFNERFLNLDAGFPKTFIALFTKPEDVIGGYMNGLRKRYLSAFSYFAISITFAGIYIFLFREYFMDSVFNDMSLAQTPQDAAATEFTKNMVNKVNEYQTLYNLASIPLIALISRLVFWNYKKYNYLEHLVIYLYAFSHANLIIYAISLATIWSNTLYIITSFASFFLYFIYIAYVLKRLYRLRFDQILLKSMLFLVIGGVLFTILSIALIIIFYKMGALDNFIENIEAAKQT
tara:strand:+ start:326 stop:1171 length:846 start_codon:yes stop_codon:yes gene_type:complete